MQNKKITQYDRVLDYLKKHKSITSLQSIRLFGNTRLSATIYNLRQDGYSISSNKVARKNRYGDKVYFARYELLRF